MTKPRPLRVWVHPTSIPSAIRAAKLKDSEARDPKLLLSAQRLKLAGAQRNISSRPAPPLEDMLGNKL